MAARPLLGVGVHRMAPVGRIIRPTRHRMLIGSLCTGYGGLDIAATALYPASKLAWMAEIDPAATTILAARYPTVPNLGDLTVADLPPADLVTVGFPCQPVSVAGQGKGANDERWIWDDILNAVRRMDPPPRLLLLENVPGLLTASGGDAMARVIEGLAALGYVGRYRILPASAVGACHQRRRWFCAARPNGQPERFQPEQKPGSTKEAQPPSALLPTPRASDANGPGFHGQGGPDLRTIISRSAGSWGNYSPAITRHTAATGIDPPSPTDPDGRLSPRFVEWMMMLPPGWVTDLDLSRRAMLRVLGNGVVPPQAVAAYRTLISM